MLFEKKIQDIKFLAGSFRITESKEILAKVERDGEYVPIYIGQLEGEIELQDLQWKPKKLKPGDLWPSIYDGTTLAVNSGGKVFITISGKKVCSLKPVV